MNGEEASDCDTDALLADVVRDMDMEVFGVPVGLVSRVSFVCVERRTGESVDLKLRAASDLRGEALRRGRDELESKLPMPCRHVMIRSFGGCVDILSLLEVRDIMLLGRPIPDARFMDAVSNCSLIRRRFAKAQSCRNTFNAPV